MVASGEIHVLLLEVCFSDLKPAAVFFEPPYAILQSARLSCFVPKVLIEPYIASLLMDQTLPAAEGALSDYAKIDAESGFVAFREATLFRC